MTMTDDETTTPPETPEVDEVQRELDELLARKAERDRQAAEEEARANDPRRKQIEALRAELGGTAPTAAPPNETPAAPAPLTAAHDSALRDAEVTDAVQMRLDALRAAKAERDAGTADPRLAEIAKLEAELSGGPGAVWSAVPRIADTPFENLDPRVAAILSQLADAQQTIAQLQAQAAQAKAIADGTPVPPPDAWLTLACGHSTKVASAVPTHHFCEEHEATVPVVSAYLAPTEPEPARGKAQ